LFSVPSGDLRLFSNDVDLTVGSTKQKKKNTFRKSHATLKITISRRKKYSTKKIFNKI